MYVNLIRDMDTVLLIHSISIVRGLIAVCPTGSTDKNVLFSSAHYLAIDPVGHPTTTPRPITKVIL